MSVADGPGRFRQSAKCESGLPDRILHAAKSTSAIPHRKKQAVKPVSETVPVIPISDSGQSDDAGPCHAAAPVVPVIHNEPRAGSRLQQTPTRSRCLKADRYGPFPFTILHLAGFLAFLAPWRLIWCNQAKPLHCHSGTWRAVECPLPRRRSAPRSRRARPPTSAVAGRRSGARSRPVRVAPSVVRRAEASPP